MTTIKDLSELGSAYTESFVPKPDLSDIKGLVTDEAVLQSLRREAEKVRIWAKTNLAVRADLAMKPEEIQELNEDKVAEFEKDYRAYLIHEIKPYRRACWLGTFDHHLDATSSRAEVRAVIAGLVQDGFLEKADEGPLKVFSETYTVPARSTFKEPELEEVTGLLRQFIARAEQAEHKARAKRSQELYDQANISFEEFLEGKAGRITLGIPPEPMLNPDGTPILKTDDSPQWRGGGTLTVESDGAGKIFPVAASGNIQRGVEEAITLKVHVLQHTLGWAFLGGIQGLDETRFKKLVLIWNLLKRGVAAEKRNLAIRAQKADLTDGIETISMKEFFIDGHHGACLVSLNKPWEPQGANEDQPVYIHNFFLLVERFMQESEDGPRTFIRVMKVPDHIGDYLAKCMDDYPEGEKFGGCPQPLQAILQATFGQVSKEEYLAEKYGR